MSEESAKARGARILRDAREEQIERRAHLARDLFVSAMSGAGLKSRPSGLREIRAIQWAFKSADMFLGYAEKQRSRTIAIDEGWLKRSEEESDE